MRGRKGSVVVVVLLLMALTFLGHFNRIAISVAGSERMMDQYGLDPIRMGVVYSAFLFTYTIAMIPAGLLADRFGAWLALGVMAVGLAAGSVATGAVGLTVGAAHVVVTLLVVRGVMGMLSAPLHPSTARSVANWIPMHRRTLVNGLTLGAAFLGIALTYYVFGALIDRVDWPVAFMITAGVTLVVGALWITFAADMPAGHRSPTLVRTSRAGWLALLRNRSVLFVTLAYTAVGYFEYLFFYWMLYYFDKVLQIGTETSRLYSTIVTLAMAGGVISGGWLSDRLVARWGARRGRAAVPVAGMIAGAIFLVVGVTAEAPLWVMIWFSLGVFAATAAEAPCWATAIELGKAHGTTAGGIMNTGANIGGFIAPIATPWIGMTFGWQWAIGLGAAVSLAGGLLWLGVKPAEDEVTIAEPTVA